MYRNLKLFSLSFITILLLIAIGFIFKNLPYEFYTIKRLLMFISLGYLSFYFFKSKYQVLTIFFAASAILFNPLFPIFLNRTFWSAVDISITLFLTYTLFISFKDKFKTNSSKNNTIDEQIKILKENCELIDRVSKNEWENKIKVIGITVGHFNENLLKKLSNIHKTPFHYSMSETINELKPHLTKSVIDDLHSLNKFRNKIIHFKDYNNSDFVDFSNIDEMTKKYYTNESKLIYSKIDYLYSQFIKK